VIEGTAKLHGCTAELKWSDQAYIPTVNDAKLVSLVEEAAGKLVGVDRWHRLAEPTMAAEDFSFLAGPSPAIALVQRAPCTHTCAPLLCSVQGAVLVISCLNGCSALQSPMHANTRLPCNPYFFPGVGIVFTADAVPGAFTFLGISNEEAASVHGLHTSRFQMDEAQMPLGAALHAAVALDALRAATTASKTVKEEL